MVELLKNAIEEKPKTVLMFDSHTNHAQCKPYLKEMIEKGLMEILPNGKYKTTDKGKEFIKSTENIIEVFPQTFNK